MRGSSMKVQVLLAIAIVIACVSPIGAQSQTAEIKPIMVSVDANGTDVRTVLHKIFTQTGKNFVVETGTYYSLYLNLSNVTFDSALETICKTAGLDYEIQDNVYHFSRPKTAKPQLSAAPIKISEPVAIRTLSAAVLNKKVNTRFSLVDIRKAMQEISAQTGVPIEVAPEVKTLRVNAYLLNTSLRFALNSITQAGGLTYAFTNHGTILISTPGAKSVSTETSSQAIATKLICDQCKNPLEKGWKYCPHCGNYVKNITK